MVSPPTVILRTKSVSDWLKGSNNKIRVLQRRAYGYRERGISQAEDRGGIPSAITQKCRFQPTRTRVDPKEYCR